MMTTPESKFTPGPWHPGCIVTRDSRCKCRGIVDERYAGGIATVSMANGIPLIADGGNDCPPEEEAIANSHLIAAAPCMYEALKLLREAFIIAWGFEPSAGSVHHEPLQKASAALTRAEGRES